MEERLQNILAHRGVASRRHSAAIIEEGRVTVDGVVCTEPGARFDPSRVAIRVDGRALAAEVEQTRTIMMYKPVGVLSSVSDPFGGTTVIDLIKGKVRERLVPVGRLDKDTSGLLLLTNDGDFAHRVISPKSNVPKRYRAEVEGVPDERDVKAFKEGIVLSDGTQCLPAALEITGGSVCFVTVMEGKYHQVKRMLSSRGKPVTELKRLSIGALALPEELEEGAVRELDEEDLCRVFMVR